MNSSITYLSIVWLFFFGYPALNKHKNPFTLFLHMTCF
ncbi:hypothetical protein ECP03018675_0405 [Escherichia coli P0301867.5]|nr:hypothetical protein ECP03018675_0405 [Escherichia coli P0301867.5]